MRLEKGWGGMRRRTGSRGFLRGCAIGAIACVVIVALVAVYLTLYVDHTSAVGVDVPARPQASATMAYTYSEAQAEVVDKLGPPDSFQILFYNEAGNEIRQESWRYYDDSWEITFVNGALVAEEAVDFQAGDMEPTPYGPHQFAAGMSLAEVLASTGLLSYVRVPVEDELVVGGEVFFGDRVAFGMKNGRLYTVEALPRTREG